MLYSVTKRDGKYIVVETATKLQLKNFDKSYEAYALCNRLNGGNGFQGWTPEFFVKNGGIINT